SAQPSLSSKESLFYFICKKCPDSFRSFLLVFAISNYSNFLAVCKTQAHHSHNAFCIDVLLADLNVHFARILARLLHKQRDRSAVKSVFCLNYNRCFNHNNPPCSCLALSASSLSLRSL